MNLIEEFNAYRSQMNEKILAEDNKVIKHSNLSSIIIAKSKEMIRPDLLMMVLTCDDYIKYLLGKCHEVKVEKIRNIRSIFNSQIN